MQRCGLQEAAKKNQSCPSTLTNIRLMVDLVILALQLSIVARGRSSTTTGLPLIYDVLLPTALTTECEILCFICAVKPRGVCGKAERGMQGEV